MSISHEIFYASLREMKKLSNHTILTDHHVGNDIRDAGARLLRHGLSVSAFSLLEKYLSRIVGDLIDNIAMSKISYSVMNEKLKRFLIIDAISGLKNKVHFTDSDKKLRFAEIELNKLASFAASPPRYTALGFSPSGSNIGHEDLKATFSAIGVNDIWGKLKDKATEIGASRLNLESDFKNLAKTRHSSAHDPTGNVPTGNLVENIDVAALLGIASALLSESISLAYLQALNANDLNNRLDNLISPYRVIDEQQDGTWLERSHVNGRAIKRYSNEQDALNGAGDRRDARIILSRDTRGFPTALHQRS